MDENEEKLEAGAQQALKAVAGAVISVVGAILGNGVLSSLGKGDNNLLLAAYVLSWGAVFCGLFFIGAELWHAKASLQADRTQKPRHFRRTERWRLRRLRSLVASVVLLVAAAVTLAMARF